MLSSVHLQVPASIEAEEALLGAVLLAPKSFIPIDTFLQSDDFFIVRHAYIWTAFQQLSSRGETIDYLTLSNELKEKGVLDEVGGVAYLTKLANSVPSSVHAEAYARVVERVSVRRKLLEATDEVRRMALDEKVPIDEVLVEVENTIRSVSSDRLSHDVILLSDALGKYYDEVEEQRTTGEYIGGISTGFVDIDSMIGGLNKSDLVVFAGRTGMGKSSWLLSTAINVAKWGHKVVIFSMEMSVEQIVQRLVAMESGFTIKRLRTKSVTDEEMSKFVEVIGRLSNLPIYIDDKPFLTPVDVRSRSKRVQQEVGLSLIIVDYIQNLSAGDKYRNNRVQEISYISRYLKETARELEVPLLAAAQLSRAVEQRNDKRPVLSDLRESGCLAGDTQIYLPDKGYSEPIASLVGKSGFRVLSLDTKTYKLEYGTVTNAFCTGTKPVYRMTTALGRTIRATGNHKFLTINGWTRLDELELNEHIATPRTLPCGEGLDEMKDAELALMAHLIGDGCTLPRHSIQYTTGKKDLAEIVSRLAKELFGDLLKPRIQKEKGHNWYQVYLPSTKPLSRKTRNPISVWLEEYGIWGLRSYEKYVPKKVFGQSSKKIALFLRHLWATDGCIHLRNSGSIPVAYYATSSYQLAKDVVYLLLRLGMNARFKEVPQGTKGRDQYHIILTGHNDMTLFTEIIGVISKKQSIHFKSIKSYLEKTVPNPNRDIIPTSQTSFYKQNISRTRASRLAKIVKSEDIHNLANSDVYWDKIVSIESDGEEDVYDLTVDTYHNFCADVILPHNSIEQDADAVLFLYRDAYYNPDVDFPGIAEVNVAKNRHGETGKAYLHFNPSNTKFSNATKLELGDY